MNNSNAYAFTNNPMNSDLAIGWINLEFSVQSLLCRKSKLILNKINGIIEFGSLNALMGPSGAGKSTLLKCINGRNNEGLGSDTKIYLNSTNKIRSCFIVQDIKDHLLIGLTAKESLIFASKLKNSREKVTIDHQKNAKDLLSELMISDIEDTIIENCSGGEQKRIVIATELTANLKPNLLCIDEPTSGLDSNAAEIVINCLKDVSRKHNIAIVTSIHQPNSDLLNMFDQLYVLAKGGFCVFDGPPKQLRMHLKDCGVICNKYQTPIEVLLKIASRNDEISNKLFNKSLQSKSELIKRCSAEARLAPNGINFKSQRFSILKFWYLFMRTMTYTYRCQWKAMIIQFILIVGVGTIITKLYNSEIGKPDGCISFGNNSIISSAKTEDALHEESLLTQNIKFNFFVVIFISFLQIVATTMTFTSEVKIFINEHKNGWYSTGAYYFAKTIVDLPLTIVITVCYVYAVYKASGQINDELRILGYLYMIATGVLCSQGLGLLIGIISENNDKLAIVLTVGTYMICVVFCGFFIVIEELPEPLQWFSYLSYTKQGFESILILIYGFSRCPLGQTPSVLYQFDLTDDKLFWTNVYILVIQVLYLRVLALIALLIKANPISFKINNRKNKTNVQFDELKVAPEVTYL